MWLGSGLDRSEARYFSNLAAATSGQQLALRDIGENYHNAALGAWQLSNQLGNILQALADKAIIAGIAAAAGTVTAETGVGAVLGYGVAALVVVDMLRLIPPSPARPCSPATCAACPREPSTPGRGTRREAGGSFRGAGSTHPRTGQQCGGITRSFR